MHFCYNYRVIYYSRQLLSVTDIFPWNFNISTFTTAAAAAGACVESLNFCRYREEAKKCYHLFNALLNFFSFVVLRSNIFMFVDVNKVLRNI